MTDALIIDALRTPIGRYAGALSSLRADDLGALPLRALCQRHPQVDWSAVDDVIYGCANQAGEDNRNVARMSALLAGLPPSVPGTTVNRLCGSGLVMAKAEQAFSRQAELHDTTLGWRFVNPLMQQQYGIDSMPETAENVAAQFNISRADQDAFALRSQQRAAAAQASGRLAREIVPVTIAQRKGPAHVVVHDEHPRAETTLAQLQKLPTPFRDNGTVTAGNASGLNDGACALLLASREQAERFALKARGRVLAMATAGVEPRIMGIGPVPATRKALALAGLSLADMEVIELNEAFAAQGLAVLRELGLADDDPRVNPNGGAIALGHPLGMSGARLVTTALHELEQRQARYALCTMCIGVGQGIALIIERLED